jgi:hypothetical protein
MIATEARITTAEQVRDGWPSGYEPEIADEDYRQVASEMECQHCHHQAIEAVAYRKRDDWGSLLRVIFRCCECGDAVEV